jgi:hypothetical protein
MSSGGASGLGWRGDLAKETSEQNYTQKYMVEMVELPTARS